MHINEILNAPFTFARRKNFSPCDMKPLWKSCLIVLVLGITGKDNAASLKKIHTANWIVKKDEHLASYMTWRGKDNKKRPNVRLEPAIDRVINLLVSNRIVIKSEGKIILTKFGVELFNELNSEDVYIQEKASLIKAKRYLSEAAVKRLFEGI